MVSFGPTKKKPGPAALGRASLAMRFALALLVAILSTVLPTAASNMVLSVGLLCICGSQLHQSILQNHYVGKTRTK